MEKGVAYFCLCNLISRLPMMYITIQLSVYSNNKSICSSSHLWRGFSGLAGGFILNFLPNTCSLEKQKTSSFPGPTRQARKPQGLAHPSSLQNTGREIVGGKDERVQRRLSDGQHVHSLHHGEGPVGCQSLSHELGTIISDPVTLEAVEARKRHITNGAHKGTHW